MTSYLPIVLEQKTIVLKNIGDPPPHVSATGLNVRRGVREEPLRLFEIIFKRGVSNLFATSDAVILFPVSNIFLYPNIFLFVNCEGKSLLQIGYICYMSQIDLNLFCKGYNKLSLEKLIAGPV